MGVYVCAHVVVLDTILITQVTRPGEETVKCTVLLMINHQVWYYIITDACILDNYITHSFIEKTPFYLAAGPVQVNQQASSLARPTHSQEAGHYQCSVAIYQCTLASVKYLSVTVLLQLI